MSTIGVTSLNSEIRLDLIQEYLSEMFLYLKLYFLYQTLTPVPPNAALEDPVNVIEAPAVFPFVLKSSSAIIY